jgi:hypothetical protein
MNKNYTIIKDSYTNCLQDCKFCATVICIPFFLKCQIWIYLETHLALSASGPGAGQRSSYFPFLLSAENWLKNLKDLKNHKRTVKHLFITHKQGDTIFRTKQIIKKQGNARK